VIRAVKVPLGENCGHHSNSNAVVWIDLKK